MKKKVKATFFFMKHIQDTMSQCQPDIRGHLTVPPRQSNHLEHNAEKNELDLFCFHCMLRNIGHVV